jgi:glutathione reductase (NADPH)
MFNLAMFLEDSHYMKHYGVGGMEHRSLDYAHFKQARDNYVKRLNGIYMNMVNNDGITFIPGLASFAEEKVVAVESRRLTAEHILIASGSAP